MSFGIEGVSGLRNWFVAKGDMSQVLSPDTTKMIKETMGFQGIKVLSVEPGIKGVNIHQILKELDTQSTQAIYQDIAKILNVNIENINSILVVLGGLELAKDQLERIKTSLKKLEAKKANKIASDLGLVEENNALIFVDEGVGFENGGWILIETGMREIKSAIKKEEELLEKE